MAPITLAVSIIAAGLIGLNAPIAVASAIRAPNADASAGNHTMPSPTIGLIKPGDSIGAVGSPLRGNTLYKGSADNSSGEAWYQLDKTGTATATIHVKNTSTGSSCTSQIVDLDNAYGSNGVVLQSTLNDNNAVTFPVTTPGLYYILLYGNGCFPTSTTTYSIEPKPSSAWIAPTPPATGTIKPGDSIGKVGKPLAGDTLYKGEADNATGEGWYQLEKTGTATATIRIENTVVLGSTNCANQVVYLDKGSGANIFYAHLGDNAATTFPVTTAGRYYIELIGDGCFPTTATTYSIEPEPGSAWRTTAP